MNTEHRGFWNLTNAESSEDCSVSHPTVAPDLVNQRGGLMKEPVDNLLLRIPNYH